MHETVPHTTPADLRAAIARSGVPAYVIGARCRVNPVRLSKLIRGRERLTSELAARILRACEHEASRRRSR